MPPVTLEGMQIDHVTIAGSSLDRLCRAFAACGLEATYGGPHANGVTHMAAVGFRDGSYIELISFLQAPGPSRFWPEMIAGDAGPCAWCLGVEDIRAESERLRALGIPVEGPSAFERRRPDGQTVAWDLSFPGEDSPGSLLPFLIQDRTPRSLRMMTSPALMSSPFGGIALILIGVRDLHAAITLFRRAWGWAAPQIQYDPYLRSEVACFAGAPVVLAQPSEGELLRRTECWGDLPAAFGLASADFDRSCRGLPVAAISHWSDGTGVRHLAWFRPPEFPAALLAIVSAGTSFTIQGSCSAGR
jgi:hypothetical protein